MASDAIEAKNGSGMSDEEAAGVSVLGLFVLNALPKFLGPAAMVGVFAGTLGLAAVNDAREDYLNANSDFERARSTHARLAGELEQARKLTSRMAALPAQGDASLPPKPGSSSVQHTRSDKD